MIKSLKAGDTILKKPNFERFLVIRVFECGWQVVDLMSAEDPAIARIILPRNFDHWIKELDIPEKEVVEKTEVSYERRTEYQWNIL